MILAFHDFPLEPKITKCEEPCVVDLSTARNFTVCFCDLWPKEFKIEQQTGLLLATLRYLPRIKIVSGPGRISMLTQWSFPEVIFLVPLPFFSVTFFLKLFNSAGFLVIILSTLIPSFIQNLYRTMNVLFPIEYIGGCTFT